MKSIEIQINASKERIWSIFTDRSNMTDWRPTHTNYSSPNSDIRGVGARFTHTVWRPGEHGPSSYETTSEIIAVEEGESVSMKIIGNAILNSMQTHCSLLADVDSTRVIIKYEYKLKYGIFGFLIDKILVGRALKKEIKEMLSNLKQFAETGEKIPKPNWMPE